MRFGKALILLVLLLAPLPAWAASAWFVAPYVRVAPPPRRALANIVHRACEIRDFAALIAADGGGMRLFEIAGNKCLVKVKASVATLTLIAATYPRIPGALLDDTLGSLTAGQRTALRQLLLDAGYTLQDVNARFPDLAAATVGDVLRYLAQKPRRKTRFDVATDTIVLDGPDQPTGNVDVLNEALP